MRKHGMPAPQVEVFEEKPIVGGACRTEHPFPKVPGLGHSTGATQTHDTLNRYRVSTE